MRIFPASLSFFKRLTLSVSLSVSFSLAHTCNSYIHDKRFFVCKKKWGLNVSLGFELEVEFEFEFKLEFEFEFEFVLEF